MSRRSAPRVFFYVQHLLGIGHQARAAAIARALCAEGLEVAYVTGGFAETRFELGGATVVQLPPARTADATFATLLDADGSPVDDAWEARRREALLTAFAEAEPDALLIESFPFGRRRFRFELLPLLDAASDLPVAASVRDILVAKDDPKRTQWIVDTIEAHFDTVIVHGDPNIIGLEATFPGTADIADRIRYSGYVAPPAAAQSDRQRDIIAISVGGGAVGGPILHASLAAKPLSSLSRAPWRLVTGPNLPKSVRKALNSAEGVTIDTYIENFNGFLSTVAVSVSQAGYNTVMDLITSRTKSVLVPFSQEGETEQTLRANLFAKRPGFHVLQESDLTPETLAEAMDKAYREPPPDPSGIDLDGAAETARIMNELATGRPISRRL